MSADGGEPENRNAEYDAFSAVYATFLLTEILPAVRDRYVISDDPDQWAVCGGSSGGSCAFTVAWMRPDRYLRVAAALSERGYDLRLVLGDGGHDPNHGGRSCQTRFAGSGEGNTSEPGGWREAPADRRWLCQRQPEPDVGAAFGAIRGVRLAEVRPCDRLHDRETEAAPFA
jgi:Putative esterase